MLSETKISKGFQTVIPSKIRKIYKINAGDILDWTDTEDGILVQPRKKRTLQDITGLIKTEGDAVESKKLVQKGLK
ncbi:MAG: AbrB/MazE/SpoVT family DNA-binding domain-containing protein [ANME-2 cluster archaeon]|jgi:AbrB family looped-hinge helix DNA binding protein|nr:AbrB/MazE/SpoVT family DNA-binding domain-containing protein [ANME-2 cluster archaeon]